MARPACSSIATKDIPSFSAIAITDASPASRPAWRYAGIADSSFRSFQPGRLDRKSPSRRSRTPSLQFRDDPIGRDPPPRYCLQDLPSSGSCRKCDQWPSVDDQRNATIRHAEDEPRLRRFRLAAAWPWQNLRQRSESRNPPVHTLPSWQPDPR